MSLVDPPFARPSTPNDPETVFPPELDPPQPPIVTHPHERFLMPPLPRLTFTTLLSYTSGSILGLAHGFRTSALRFRAENSHRTPFNQRGWYLYHRAKNAYAFRHGLREANRMGLRIAPWTALFFGIEEAVDQVRIGDTGEEGRKDFLSTTIAGGAVAGAFSAWSSLPMVVAARMVRMGLGVGVGFGLVQDYIFWARGQRVGWIGLLGRLMGRGEKSEDGGAIGKAKAGVRSAK
ncbi:MAG: hypothetical protein Q9162_007194 [Coniocarpon cinnabarinum]